MIKLISSAAAAAVMTLSFAHGASAQVAPMVPGSQLTAASTSKQLGSVKETTCPIRRGEAIRAVWANNGWVVGDFTRVVAEEKTDARQFRRFTAWTVSTVHPKDKRIRSWRVEAEEVVRPDTSTEAPGWISSCSETAILLGDRTDDTLMIDIGVAFVPRFPEPQPGQTVSRLVVSRPAYCDAKRSGFPGKSGAFPAIDCAHTTGLTLPAKRRQTKNTKGLVD